VDDGFIFCLILLVVLAPVHCFVGGVGSYLLSLVVLLIMGVIKVISLEICPPKLLEVPAMFRLVRFSLL
jgi:hypothetical protein